MIPAAVLKHLKTGMPRTLRVRLLLTILVPMVALIIGAFFAAIGLNQTSLETSMTNALEDRVAALKSQAERLDSAAVSAWLATLKPGLAITDERLEVVPAGASTSLLSAQARAEIAKSGSASGAVTLGGARHIYAATQAGPQILVLLRLFPEEPVLVPGAYVALGAGFGIPALAIALLTSFLVARAVVRPIERVGEAGRELAAGGAPAVVPVGGPREMRRLAGSFNDMAAELTQAREAERAFLTSVSHELKTPLAAIEGYAEGLRDNVLAPAEAGAVILEESRRLERLVFDLLILARLREARFAIKEEIVDLQRVADDVMQRHDLQARTLGVRLEAHHEPDREAGLGADSEAKVKAHVGRSALGDADRLVQAVSNLVENALRHAPAGSSVIVDIRDAEVSVIDQGPGLSSEDVEHAFERFYLYRRYGSDRPVGTGLGLAVVKELVEAMGGRMSVASAPGKGACFTLHLREAARS